MIKSFIFLLVAIALPTLAIAANMTQRTLTDIDVLALADNQYSSGELPLGDNRYVTEKPLKGSIFLCRVYKNEGGEGAQRQGSWIHSGSWNKNNKLHVEGDIAWPNARFNNSVTNDKRTLEGNGLPLNHNTGLFPVRPSDFAFAYDRNPNAITAQNLRDILPTNPEYSDQPICMGGEAGIMLTGVPLYNGFDANLRDAAAHEVQDKCDGHPQKDGQYHYHSLSSCIKNISVKTVLGYALDGFPITGPLVAEGRYLTTSDLDECHGITSEIMEDGEKKVTYHYVMTQDFPYSVSCFRGQPVRFGPSTGMLKPPKTANEMLNRDDFADRPRQPPTATLLICSGKKVNDACLFATRQGEIIHGTCRTPPDSNSLLCVPIQAPMGPPGTQAPANRAP